MITGSDIYIKNWRREYAPQWSSFHGVWTIPAEIRVKAIHAPRRVKSILAYPEGVHIELEADCPEFDAWKASCK